MGKSPTAAPPIGAAVAVRVLHSSTAFAGVAAGQARAPTTVTGIVPLLQIVATIDVDIGQTLGRAC
jgi:hypothetical protein